MDVKDLTEQFESYQNYTIEARALSERDQNYDDHHQWSDTDIETLNTRNQAPVVINRIKVKVNRLVGLQKASRTQVRALPRTPKHEEAADAATEAIRYVEDNTDFEMKSSDVFRDIIVPGYGGAIVEFNEDESEILVNKIPWDRYYYDPHSRELDFSDKNYDGIIIWMDKADAKDTFPDKAQDIETILTAHADQTGSETFDDKPRHWVTPERDRIRIAQHFYKEKGVWMMAFFTEGLFLIGPKKSPYLDEFGKPQNPIECQTAYIDRELQRYGEARSYIWLQDEVNHRRSRLLYAGSVTRTMGDKGAVEDVNAMKTELAKANGHIEINPGFYDKFQIIPNSDISETQLLLYRESKAEIDDIGINDSLAGRGNARSGRQDQIQQQAGRIELASLYDGHKHWEKRIRRQIWNRIKQGWKAEKWIRVTDDKNDLQWVGLNQPVTKGDLMLQAAQGDDELAQAAQIMLQQMRGDPDNGIPADPRLLEVEEVQNNVTEMDVDIILTEAPDTHTLRQETFEAMMKLAEHYGKEDVPFAVALELSDLPNKKEAKELLNPPPDPQQQQIQKMMFDLDVRGKEADISAKEAKAGKDIVETESQIIENEIVKDGYPNIVADRDADSVAKKLDNIQKSVETEKLATEPTTSVSVNT